MKEISSEMTLFKEKRCSNCVYGHKIVAFVMIGNIHDDGSKTREYYTDPIPVGQTRNCFSWLEKKLYRPEKFIYPNEDDTCINPKKFRTSDKKN